MVVETVRPTTTETLPRLAPPADSGGYRVSSVVPHATGLRLPGHLGMLPDGRVLVSEFGGGIVRDVTDAGDYRDVNRAAFATGFEHPGGILPTAEGRIIVADSGAGTVADISSGGSTTSSDVLMDGLSNPYGLVEFQGSLFSSFSNDRHVGMARVIEGGTFEENDAFVRDFPVVTPSEPYHRMGGCGGDWPGVIKDDELLLGHSALGAIFNVTDGGSFTELRERRWAWGFNLPLGMTTDPTDHDLYVVERGTGVIKRLVSSGYGRFAEPLIAGFRDPSCIRFTPDASAAYICDRAVGTVYRLTLERRLTATGRNGHA